jgi:hypothetical protein
MDILCGKLAKAGFPFVAYSTDKVEHVIFYEDFSVKENQFIVNIFEIKIPDFPSGSLKAGGWLAAPG